MLTEGKNYEDKLIKLNPIMNKLNRYKDILPCKIYFLSDEYNRVEVFGDRRTNESISKNYINASFIHVNIEDRIYLLKCFYLFFSYD
jgi:protein tyrosine phosphatase